MPGNADPRVNLAVVMEQAGRNDDTRAAYESALEVVPEYMPAMQGLAMLAARDGSEDRRLSGWLGRIAVEGESAEWREWARNRVSRP
jgi:hypothetical protein